MVKAWCPKHLLRKYNADVSISKLVIFLPLNENLFNISFSLGIELIALNVRPCGA